MLSLWESIPCYNESCMWRKMQLYNMKGKVPVVCFSGWWIWKGIVSIWIIKDRRYTDTRHSRSWRPVNLNLLQSKGILNYILNHCWHYVREALIVCGNSYWTVGHFWGSHLIFSGLQYTLRCTLYITFLISDATSSSSSSILWHI